MLCETQSLVGITRPGAKPGGAFAPPEIFKTLHGNFDIKMKSYILIIFKKSHWNFSLS